MSNRAGNAILPRSLKLMFPRCCSLAESLEKREASESKRDTRNYYAITNTHLAWHRECRSCHHLARIRVNGDWFIVDTSNYFLQERLEVDFERAYRVSVDVG